MLYFFLKYVSILLVKVFYRQVSAEDAHRVPKSGPVILASNHPNTMMDPLLLAILSGRNPHFLGKSTLFNTALNRWFFNTVHVLPVYRKQDAANDMDKNQQVFDKCFESLEQGNALVIMPEGMSQMDGTLHQIKTGTARIALGAEVRNSFELGVKIIPAGIYYSSPTNFFEDVHCKFGRPIDLADYAELFEKDEVEAVYEITNQIRSALEKLTTTVRDEEAAEALKNLKKIYALELSVDLDLAENDVREEFRVSRGLADAINWYHTHEPAAFNTLSLKMRKYLAKVEGLELRDDLFSTKHGQRTFLKRALGLLGVIFGSPIYLWGGLNNIIPYKLTRVAIWILKPTLEYLSTFKMISGALLFLTFYALQTYLVQLFLGSGLVSFLYLLSLVPSGRFALYFQGRMRYYRQHLRLLTLFLKRKTLLLEIMEEREMLMTALHSAKHEYLNRREEGSGPDVPGEDTKA